MRRDTRSHGTDSIYRTLRHALHREDLGVAPGFHEGTVLPCSHMNVLHGKKDVTSRHAMSSLSVPKSDHLE